MTFLCLKYMQVFPFKLLILMDFSQSYKLLRSFKKQGGYMVFYVLHLTLTLP